MATPPQEYELDLSEPAEVSPALLLPATLLARDALPRLLASEADTLAVRRVEGLTVYWYSFPMDWARERVRQADPQATLKRVLDLHEFLSAPVRSADHVALKAPLEREAIVLDGDRFVGVQRPSASHRPHAPRPEQVVQVQQQVQQHVRHQERDPFTQHQNALPPEMALPEMAGAEPPNASIEMAPEAMPEALPETTAPPALQPFSAHPRLDAPDVVQPLQAFTVNVGLAEQAQAGVIGGPVVLDLPANVQTFELDVQLIVEGFEAPPGQGLRATLQVNRAHPGDASVHLQLIAPALASDEPTRLSSLRVLYLFEGQVCGVAQRRIAVVANQPQVTEPARVQGHGQLWTDGGQQTTDVNVRPGLPPVDLTIVIAKPDRDPSQGSFVWSFMSPHTQDLPLAPVPTNLGNTSAAFGSKLISQAEQFASNGMADLMITGNARIIRNAAPAELWQALRTVDGAVKAAGQSRPLNVQLLTAEHDVAWELALLEETELLIADAPPFLAAQVNLARWPLDNSCLPPRTHIDVHHMVAVVGDYAARSNKRKLEQAMEEGAALVKRYQAAQVSAEVTPLTRLLRADPSDADFGQGAEAVHFACHGEALGEHVLNAAVIMADGCPMPPELIAGTKLGKRCAPFLFMNACQVGRSANDLGGACAGFAGAATTGGFRGFVGPLWSVEDQLARDIALGFYDQVFGDERRAPRPVAEVLREARGRFVASEPNSLTRLAYVFYGHPGLTLRRVPRCASNQPPLGTSTTEPQP